MHATAQREVIEWGAERARVGRWRGDRSVAYLHPAPGAPLPSVDFVKRCLGTLATQGFSSVVTGALAQSEQIGFRAAGFTPTEQLHLLAHDMRSLPTGSVDGVAVRRARARDRPSVLAVDHLAFDAFWRLDSGGLDDAIAATPRARFRVAADDEGVLAYAITGRAGTRGYLQRLAVHPDYQRRGIGRVLVADALRWLRRWRADRAMVNTQIANGRALLLYEGLGFRREPTGLAVLGITL